MDTTNTPVVESLKMFDVTVTIISRRKMEMKTSILAKDLADATDKINKDIAERENETCAFSEAKMQYCDERGRSEKLLSIDRTVDIQEAK